MNTLIGPESDLTAKQILLNIKDDKQFVAACRSNKRMSDICRHADVWKERLEKYYPQYVYLASQYGISWRRLYPLISLFAELSDSYKTPITNKAYAWRDNDTLTAKIKNRIANYVINTDLDLLPIIKNMQFNLNELSKVKLSKNDIVFEYNNIMYRIIANLFLNSDKRVFKLKNQMTYPEDFNALFIEYAPIDFILEDIDSYDYQRFYIENISEFTPNKALAYIQRALELDPNMKDDLITIVYDTINSGFFRAADFMISKLDRDAISSILTEVLIKFVQDYDNINVLLSFMIGRRIQPDYIKLFDASISLSNSILIVIKSFAAGNIFPTQEELDKFQKQCEGLHIYDDILQLLKNV